MTLATSSGLSMRPPGIERVMSSRLDEYCADGQETRGTRTPCPPPEVLPGEMQLTRTPLGVASSASTCVMCQIPPLAAAWIVKPSTGWKAASADMFTMAPEPCSYIVLSASWLQKNV